jgi:hypothetical protein
MPVDEFSVAGLVVIELDAGNAADDDLGLIRGEPRPLSAA